VLFSWVLGWLNPEEDDQSRALIDFGLAGVNVFGLLMAVLMGSSLLRREMERRTLYTVLSREVTRTQFVAGKYLGLVAVFATGLCLVALVMVLYFSVFGTVGGLPLMLAIYGNLLEIAVLTAVSVLLGSFTTPALASIGTVSLYMVGHNTETLLEYLDMTRNESLEVPLKALYYAFPNLTNFNFRLAASFGDAIPLEVVGMATGYAVLWVGILLSVASAAFRRRELP
jgi:ABC-type transport system involved in multi-copper enzyme maturation permease subunit